MIKFIKFIFIAFISICFLFTISLYTKADSTNYSVNPILSNNLASKGYFDYKVNSNQKIKLWFQVNNNSNQTILVKNSLNDGFSDDNGRISYSQNRPNGLLKSKTPRLSSMVIGNRIKYVQLKPHTSKKVFFEVKTPEKKFNGDVLGGIHSSLCSYDSSSSNKSIYNVINYSTTVLLKSNDELADVSKLKMSGNDVSNKQINFAISNKQSKVLYGYKILVELINNKKITLKNDGSNYSLAPDSIGKYKINLFNINPGAYDLRVKVYNGKYSKYFNKTVFVKNKYQILGTYDKKNNSYKFRYIIITLFLLFILTITILICKYLKISRWYK